MEKKNNLSNHIIPVDTIPDYFRDYILYIEVVKNLAPKSIQTYYIQIRKFLEWVADYRLSYTNAEGKPPLCSLPISSLSNLNEMDIQAYLSYLVNTANNSATTRRLALTSTKSFYDYLVKNAKLLDKNPVADIPKPKKEKTMPKYLSLDESISLLNAVDGEEQERDYCIITIFLNCGIRLSELVAANVEDVKDNTLRIYGKGRKERIVYLNAACSAALTAYLQTRKDINKKNINHPLFISKRTGNRITGRRVEQIVEKYLRASGVGGRGYSPHKLRHTAATLMYQNGADVLTLKEILGHTSVATTEIYTHLHNTQVKNVMENSPLAGERAG